MVTIKEKYKKNVKNPQSTFLGKMQLRSMNIRHNKLALWGLSYINLREKSNIIDIGCGGGKNISNMAKQTYGKVVGIDISQASVTQSIKKNLDACENQKAFVVQTSIENCPFNDEIFDFATAFETIYFWDLKKAFQEVYRILCSTGQFMIVNEAYDKQGMEEIIDMVGFEIYTPQQIEETLKEVGFLQVEMKFHPNGKWLCVLATK